VRYQALTRTLQKDYNMNMQKNSKTQKHEQGFISIFSVLIIMSILTLVLVGFSTITRRAQRQTLDNQLNTQAYYAAESGVNDAERYLTANPSSAITTCQSAAFPSSTLDASLNVGYSCLLINTKLSTQIFSSVPIEGTASPITTNFASSTGVNISTFDVEWSSPSGNKNAPNGGNLEPSATWSTANNLGIVRMDIIPIDQGLTRANLATGGFSFFLYPSSNSASANAFVQTGSAGQGGLVDVLCPSAVVTAASPCVAHVTLNAVPGTALSSKYILRLQSIYSPINVTVKNGVDVNGTSFTWDKGQAVVDSTGYANDVFRRIQVRLPQLPSNTLPASFAVQTADSICKRLQAAVAGTNVDSSGGVLPVDSAPGGSCYIPTLVDP
jgi:Tfp pilus assembly protein PilX